MGRSQFEANQDKKVSETLSQKSDALTHAHNSSYWGGGGRRIMVIPDLFEK
jgi:hypothetical protein